MSPGRDDTPPAGLVRRMRLEKIVNPAERPPTSYRNKPPVNVFAFPPMESKHASTHRLISVAK